MKVYLLVSDYRDEKMTHVAFTNKELAEAYLAMKNVQAQAYRIYSSRFRGSAYEIQRAAYGRTVFGVYRPPEAVFMLQEIPLGTVEDIVWMA